MIRLGDIKKIVMKKNLKGHYIYVNDKTFFKVLEDVKRFNRNNDRKMSVDEMVGAILRGSRYIEEGILIASKDDPLFTLLPF